MLKVVECVPNFSEGRDHSKVNAIIRAMSIPGVHVLAHEMDADHNRCVVTLAGSPDEVMEAAVRGVGRAAELIDLTQHKGAHPRMGAADVVPFIPVENVTLEECAALARKAGSEIWRRFKIPVYLYEAAAMRPERQNLENVRRGQFEGIRTEIVTLPARAPDFGEARIHPTAGAVAVGARKFLIAYNIFLSTPEVEIAKKIAKAVRYSSGGLRFVKGMGVSCRGMAQVSMNLTDFEQTSMARVYEFVKREAERYGVHPVSSEIVGLIPARALEDAAEWYLQVENFSASMILENRLAALENKSSLKGSEISHGVETFLEQLRAPVAVPGGGSAAAAAGAMAASLAHMVAAMSRPKKKYAQYDLELQRAMSALTAAGEKLKNAINEDARAYAGVLAAHRESKTLAAGEPGKIRGAIRLAIEVPREVAELGKQVEQIAESLKTITSPGMASDLIVAIALARAAVEGAIANVEINLPESGDQKFNREVMADIARLRGEASAEKDTQVPV